MKTDANEMSEKIRILSLGATKIPKEKGAKNPISPSGHRLGASNSPWDRLWRRTLKREFSPFFSFIFLQTCRSMMKPEPIAINDPNPMTRINSSASFISFFERRDVSRLKRGARKELRQSTGSLTALQVGRCIASCKYMRLILRFFGILELCRSIESKMISLV